MPRVTSRQVNASRVSEPPAGIAPLSPAQVQARTDASSFKRGQSYARERRLFARLRRGPDLFAGCYGSSGGPYRVMATLAAAGSTGANPVAFSCDCPRGDFCKHVVALLLTWIEAPASFEERPPVAELLTGQSREDLVALIEAMVRRAPELEDLIELPLPTADSLPPDPLDEAAIRRQLEDAIDLGEDEDDFTTYGDWRYESGWHGVLGPAHDDEKLKRLVALGRACADAGRWRDAMAVFATLVEVVGGDLEATFDEGGSLIGALSAADEVLAACLDAQARLQPDQRLAASDRQRLIEVMLELWEADADVGGYGIAEYVRDAIVLHASTDERAGIERRLRALVRPASNGRDADNWLAAEAIGFLLKLAGNKGIPPDDLLELTRAARLWADTAGWLLEFGRTDEAIATAARHFDSAIALTGFADQLVDPTNPEATGRALDLIESRLWEREGKSPPDDVHLLNWLETRYTEFDRPDKALDAVRRRFKTAPSAEAYAAIKAAQSRAGGGAEEWRSLRAQLIAALTRKGHWATLVEIYLAEDDVADALAALKQAQRAGSTGNGGARAVGWMAFGRGPDLAMKVAAAAERSLPDEAIALYREQADRRIAERQRTSYKEAARLLARIRETLERAGRGDEWRTTIAALRLQHKSLRALREELDALGLT